MSSCGWCCVAEHGVFLAPPARSGRREAVDPSKHSLGCCAMLREVRGVLMAHEEHLHQHLRKGWVAGSRVKGYRSVWFWATLESSPGPPSFPLGVLREHFDATGAPSTALAESPSQHSTSWSSWAAGIVLLPSGLLLNPSKILVCLMPSQLEYLGYTMRQIWCEKGTSETCLAELKTTERE